MRRGIYAITMLLSFTVVFSHMMVPHHHHEAFEVEFSNSPGYQKSHAHIHKDEHNHHSHGEEEQDNQTEDHSDHGFPGHFHISVADDFDLARINRSVSDDLEQKNQYIVNSELFRTRYSEPPNISSVDYARFETIIHPQHEPRANSLRGPPALDWCANC